MSWLAYVFEVALDDLHAVLRQAFEWHGDIQLEPEYDLGAGD